MLPQQRFVVGVVGLVADDEVGAADEACGDQQQQCGYVVFVFVFVFAIVMMMAGVLLLIVVFLC